MPSMLEVNLLPRGADAGGRRPSAALAALGARLGRLKAVVGDPYLVGAVVATLLAVAAVGTLRWTVTKEADALAEREEAAKADSARFAAATVAVANARKERDAVERQLQVISQIDSSRYVWAHVLDEVSRSLPPYTWLTSVTQTSAPPAPPGLPTDTTKTEAKAKADAAKADSAAAAGLTFRVVGQTVDLQALTLFMRDLEASPFLERVQLVRSEAVLAEGKEVTEFTLDGAFRAPSLAILRTQTLTIPLLPAR